MQPPEITTLDPKVLRRVGLRVMGWGWPGRRRCPSCRRSSVTAAVPERHPSPGRPPWRCGLRRRAVASALGSSQSLRRCLSAPGALSSMRARGTYFLVILRLRLWSVFRGSRSALGRIGPEISPGPKSQREQRSAGKILALSAHFLSSCRPWPSNVRSAGIICEEQHRRRETYPHGACSLHHIVPRRETVGGDFSVTSLVLASYSLHLGILGPSVH